MRFYVGFFGVYAFLMAALLIIFGFQGRKTENTPLEIFPDMDRQSYVLPQQEFPWFANDMGDRPIPVGVIPTTDEMQETYPFLQPLDMYQGSRYLMTGRNADGEFGDGIPVPVTREFMAMGREKYELFCTICHGRTGDGNGITKSYGIIATPSYHMERYYEQPDGQIYNTIANGYNTMGAYGKKLSIEERWAVVAYVRALQRARTATLEDVPLAERRTLLGL